MTNSIPFPAPNTSPNNQFPQVLLHAQDSTSGAFFDVTITWWNDGAGDPPMEEVNDFDLNALVAAVAPVIEAMHENFVVSAYYSARTPVSNSLPEV